MEEKLYVYVVVYRIGVGSERTYGTYRSEEKAGYALLREMTNITRNCRREETPINLVWEKVIPANGLDYTTFLSVDKDRGAVMGTLSVSKVQVE